MKKIILTIFICLYSFLLQAQQINYQLDTNPSQLTTTQINGYYVIELKDATYLEGDEYVGDPQLPVKTIQLILPPGTLPSDVNVSVGQQQTLSGTYGVFPTQPPQILDFREPTAFKLPKDTYCMWSSSLILPLSITKNTSTGNTPI